MSVSAHWLRDGRAGLQKPDFQQLAWNLGVVCTPPPRLLCKLVVVMTLPLSERAGALTQAKGDVGMDQNRNLVLAPGPGKQQG